MMPFYSEVIGLIGIDSGHKTVSTPVVNSVDDQAVTGLSVRQNSGVAVVVPAEKIGELLDEEVFVAQRKTIANEAQGQQINDELATSDIAETSGTPVIVREDFLSDLVKVSRLLPPHPKPDPTKP